MKTFLSMLFLLIMVSAARAQLQPPVVGFQESKFPALAGWHGGMRASLNYLNKWPGISATQTTSNLGIDGYLHKIRSAVSLNLIHNRQNGWWHTHVENTININVAPKIKIGNGMYFSPCASFNFANSTSGYPYDGSILHKGQVEGLPYHYYGIGAGAAFFYKNFVAAAQSNFINRPYPYLKGKYKPAYSSPAPGQVSVYAAQRIQFNEKYSLTPSASYTRFGEFNHISANLNFQRNWLYLSSGYVLNNSVVFGFGAATSKAIRLSYMYEMGISALSTTALGSHYFSFRALLFRNKAKRVFMEDMPLL